MNVLEHYVTEIIGEPYYDDYGSGNYHWWLKVKALCYGSECETTLMFDIKEELERICNCKIDLLRLHKNLRSLISQRIARDGIYA